MKAPRARKSAIDLGRIRRWVSEFATYRHNVPEERIRDWIKQFKTSDHDLAARLLDCVEFYSHDQVAAAFRGILNGLPGWDADPEKRKGKWRFVPFSSSAGESGDSMTHKFRHANNLAGKKYNELFIHRSDILREDLGENDVVVLIDDFIGTGSQVCEAWSEQFGELLAEVGSVYLVVVAGCNQGLKRISDEVGLDVVVHHLLDDSDNIFADSCKHFSDEEKHSILKYCETANSREPRGKGDCGLVVVFAHTCPNNSIPILSSQAKAWEGLFRRYN